MKDNKAMVLRGLVISEVKRMYGIELKEDDVSFDESQEKNGYMRISGSIFLSDLDRTLVKGNGLFFYFSPPVAQNVFSTLFRREQQTTVKRPVTIDMRVESKGRSRTIIPEENSKKSISAQFIKRRGITKGL